MPGLINHMNVFCHCYTISHVYIYNIYIASFCLEVIGMQIVCIHNYKLKSQLVLKLYFKVCMYVYTYSKFCVGNLLIFSPCSYNNSFDISSSCICSYIHKYNRLSKLQLYCGLNSLVTHTHPGCAFIQPNPAGHNYK